VGPWVDPGDDFLTGGLWVGPYSLPTLSQTSHCQGCFVLSLFMSRGPLFPPYSEPNFSLSGLFCAIPVHVPNICPLLTYCSFMAPVLTPKIELAPNVTQNQSPGLNAN
jgi:hypothetical protein